MKKALASAVTTLAIAVWAGPASLPTASAQSSSDRAPTAESSQPGSDAWITAKVKAELAITDDVKSLDISVDTVNGVVSLTGVLPSDVMVKKAVAAAKSVKGVKKVDSAGLKVKS